MPQAVSSQTAPTLSPILTAVTADPTADTTPAPSWPGMKGGVGFTGQSPFTACRSVWQTPDAFTLMRMLVGVTSGMGTLSILSGFLNSRTTAARMIA